MIHKTNMTSTSDRVDVGYNIEALSTAELNCVAVAPRNVMNSIGNNFKVESNTGYKLFFKCGLYYTTDVHPGEDVKAEISQNIVSAYTWNGPWQRPCGDFIGAPNGVLFANQHGTTVWGPSGAHFCSMRCCLGEGTSGGMWFNTEPETGTVRFSRGYYQGKAYVKFGCFN